MQQRKDIVVLMTVILALPACISRIPLLTISLRHQPAKVSRMDVVSMIQAQGFNHPTNLADSDLSGSIQGNFRHHYEVKIINRHAVVIDHSTGLMWQQTGSSKTMSWHQGKAYVNHLNEQQFAGYTDWRLPTIVELTSLLEFSRSTDSLYIAPLFAPFQKICWSSDMLDNIRSIWFVYFAHGYVSNIDASNHLYVRAVRTLSL